MIWYMIYDMIWYGVEYDMIYAIVWYDRIYDIIYDIWYDIWYVIWYIISYMIWYDIWPDLIWYMIWCVIRYAKANDLLAMKTICAHCVWFILGGFPALSYHVRKSTYIGFFMAAMLFESRSNLSISSFGSGNVIGLCMASDVVIL
jgi:hypothetical protein